MLDERMITIGFHFVSENGCTYDATSTAPIYYDIGDDVQSYIGTQLNNFLRQIGFNRQNDLMFMESVSDEEYDFLAEKLWEYREEKGTNI